MKVLAAIDGSCQSQSVIDALAQRVWEARTVIKLVTVIDPCAGPYRTKGGYASIEKPLAEAPSQAHQNLAQFAQLLSHRLGPQNTSVLIDPEIIVGHATDTILALAENWQADLVVVGSHGRRRLEEVLLGSVSKAVLDHAMTNVLIAKSGTESTNKDAYRILVPVDQSSFSRAAVEWLVQQRWTKPVEILLMTALPELSQISALFASEANPERAAIMLSQIQSREAHPLELLETWAADIKRTTNAYVFCSAMAGDPQDVIVTAASDWHADLIVMGSHGRTGLTRLLLGSVSSSVSHSAQCAVEVVKTPHLQEHLGHYDVAPSEVSARTNSRSFPIKQTVPGSSNR
jgi:nucleotide-binding universal stress UspA family protein